ncbi:hypothetical protein I4641_13760 [Waterburya agarophytonicola K14]|uniref:Uncharacterized protein n=2 Tax=Waterburya TaxID=2886915 RepID=A0A964FGI0_9CYAN|nr:hypothetical protein [Waterburya agarophytonicola KI4]
MSSDRYNSSQFQDTNNPGQRFGFGNSRSSSKTSNLSSVIDHLIKQDTENTSAYQNPRVSSTDDVSIKMSLSYPTASLYERGCSEMLFDPDRAEKLIEEYVDRILNYYPTGEYMPSSDPNSYFILKEMRKDKRVSQEMRREIVKRLATAKVNLSRRDEDSPVFNRIGAAVMGLKGQDSREEIRKMFFDIFDDLNYPALVVVLNTTFFNSCREAISLMERVLDSTCDSALVLLCSGSLRFLYARYSPEKISSLDGIEKKIDPTTDSPIDKG